MGFLFSGDEASETGSLERRKTMDIEQAATEVLVNQLEIARQSIEDRDRRIWELQKRVELLEQMLNRAAAQQIWRAGASAAAGVQTRTQKMGCPMIIVDGPKVPELSWALGTRTS